MYAYGFRNPQGLALRPGTDQMWLVEHGPKHDDEINLLAPGGNYGWGPDPGQRRVGLLRLFRRGRRPHDRPGEFPSARQARWSSGFPTLATSGAVFLDGPQWGEWEGRLAVATLKTKSIRVFEFTEQGDFVSQIVVPELDGSHNRLRTPVLGPDGALYIATSNLPGNDRILRVTANRARDGSALYHRHAPRGRDADGVRFERRRRGRVDQCRLQLPVDTPGRRDRNEHRDRLVILRAPSQRIPARRSR